MNKEFVKYEEALALKELGFDEPTMFTYYRKKLGYVKNSVNGETPPNLPYPKYVAAPLYQQAFRWFREKYNLKANPGFIDEFMLAEGCVSDSSSITEIRHETYPNMTPEETTERIVREQILCLKKLIEIVKGKK